MTPMQFGHRSTSSMLISYGNLAKKQILWSAQMSRAFGIHMDDIFTSSDLGDTNTRYKEDKSDHFDVDIRVFVKWFLDEKLFPTYEKGRVFHGFKDIYACYQPTGEDASYVLVSQLSGPSIAFWHQLKNVPYRRHLSLILYIPHVIVRYCAINQTEPASPM